MPHDTREGWLRAAVDRLRPAFRDAGAPLPAVVHVSCGWPRGARGGRGAKVIGQCWAGTKSADGNPHLFVSPILSGVFGEAPAGEDRPGKAAVSDVLVHELVHAAVGTECGHKGAFVRAAKAVGLTGKMTATVPGVDLLTRLNALLGDLGPYPHPALADVETKKKGSRLLKLECPCGRILRGARETVEAGPVVCGVCEQAFVLTEGA
jgi:hypothetical protein